VALAWRTDSERPEAGMTRITAASLSNTKPGTSPTPLDLLRDASRRSAAYPRLVRTPTVNKILLGTLGGMALLLLLIDSGQAPAMLAVFGTVAGLLYLVHRIREVPRRDAYQDAARVLGLHHAASDTRGLSELPHPLLHRAAEIRDVEHVLSGAWHGTDVVAFEYRYTAGSAQGQSAVHEYSCVLRPVPASWPDLIAEPERMPTRAADVLGLRDIDLEHEGFNRAFEVRSADPRFASAFIDARMMAWLMGSASDYGFEIVGHRLLVFGPRVSPWEVGSVLATTDAFLAQVPPIIGSMFPGLP
jgi:hypothetical protein